MKNKLNYNLMSGSELHAFVRNLYALYTVEKTTDPLLSRLVGKVDILLSDFLKGFEYDAKDPLTVETVEKDLLRDKYWNGFKNYVKSFVQHPDASKAAAAVKIESAIKRYGWTANRFSLDEESTAILGLLNELGEKFAAEVAALQVQDIWLTPLAQAQDAFDAVQTRRVENGAVYMPSQKQFRKPLIEAVNRLIGTTETVAEDSNDAVLKKLVQEVDELIGRTMVTHKATATRGQNDQAPSGGNMPTNGA
jgi:hypothetical protein